VTSVVGHYGGRVGGKDWIGVSMGSPGWGLVAQEGIVRAKRKTETVVGVTRGNGRKKQISVGWP